jgi:phospholipid transport system transporter-binding protein
VNTLTLTRQDSGEFLLQGELTFHSINKNTVDILKNHSKTPHLIIDLIDIERADSAGLALLIEWIKRALKNNQQLCFKNIPEQLLALAALSGIDRSDFFIKHCIKQTKHG